MSGPNTAKVANKFELSGNGTTITYSSTGIGGKPSLSYKDRKFDMQFSGNQIRTERQRTGRTGNSDARAGRGRPEVYRNGAYSGHRSGKRQFPSSDDADDREPTPRCDSSG